MNIDNRSIKKEKWMKFAKKHLQLTILVFLSFTILCGLFSSVSAGEPAHKVVIQVSNRDPVTQDLALNNAANLLEHYGEGNVSIEIVAYGPGLGLFTDKSTQARKVRILLKHKITLSACSNSIAAIKKKTGKEPVLMDGVGIVPAGVARVVELQEQGYAYVRP
jgi:intracellular sulfur oxidation DsrE/DsrF family protein